MTSARLLVSVSILVAALSVSGCYEAKKDVSAYLARAQEFEQQGDVPKAKVELQNAVAADPANAQASFALAKLLDQSGDLQAAIPFYLKAAAPSANLLQPQLRIVELLLDSNRFTEAAGRINAAVGAFPESADALALRADLAERQSLVVPAKTDADAALRKDRTNPRALAVLAMLKLHSKDGQGALALVEQGLEKHAKDLRLLQVKAAILLTLNQPDQAVDALKSIVSLSPRNAGIQSALAKVEAANGHLDDAIAQFRTAVEADPDNQDMQLAFVRFLAGQDRGNDAVAFLQKLIAANPTSGTYDQVLAEYYRSRGDLDQSGAVLAKSEQRLPDGKARLAVRVAQAKIEAQKGRIGGALDRLQSVLASDPGNEEALLFRAALNAENNRSVAAMTDLLAVVRDNPINPRAFQALATAYLATNQPGLAAEAMQRAVAVAPGDTGAQLRLAAFLQRAGQTNASQDVMTRLTLQEPTNRAVWAANGQLAIDRKDWAAVARSITRLRELPGPSFDVSVLDGRSKAERGDFAGAAKSYQDAIASDPNIDAAAFGIYARASVATGKAKEGADFIAQHVANLTGASLQQAWAAVMTLRADAGDFAGADEAFRHTVAAAPKDAEVYAGYLRILIAQKRYDQARQVVEAGLSAGASPGSMLLLRGSISEAVGDLPAAARDYKDALRHDPLSLAAANNYGSLVADLQPKDTDVLQQARSSLSGAERSTDPLLLDTIGWLDYRLGRVDEAARVLAQANAARSANPQLRFHMAAVMLALGDKTGGTALLDTVKGLRFPGSDEARALSET